MKSQAAEVAVRIKCINRLRGGCSLKTHALTDSVRLPLHLQATQGQDHDIAQAEALLAAASAAANVADTVYDSKNFGSAFEAKSIALVVMRYPNRKNPRCLDDVLYTLRYNVDRFLHSLKRFRRVASRYEKTARDLKGMAHVACALLWVEVGCI